MSPREEDKEELIDDVRVRDIKVVLQGGDVDIAANLRNWLAVEGQGDAYCTGREDKRRTYVLLDIFLSMFEGSLSKLCGNLRRRIVHELAIRPKDIACVGALLLLIGIAAVPLLRLRGARRRGRRSELRDRRDVLRHGMVQRGRLPVICSLHGGIETSAAAQMVGVGGNGLAG